MRLETSLDLLVDFFRLVFNQIATLTKLTTSATGILGFAKGLGTTLGKIFLPVTILMSAFDFVTGFIEGYTEGGYYWWIERWCSKSIR